MPRDTESTWEEIPDADIEACYDVLPHLDPQGWAFCLPRHEEGDCDARAASEALEKY